MLADIAGRVRNTKLSPQHSLLPLFEAVVNSIYACDQRDDDKPTIDVILNREKGTAPLIEGFDSSPIDSFEVVDNGDGFTDANYRSFRTTDSRQKAHVGGKGIGRFLWLKAFERAEVSSVYHEPGDGQWMRRTFTLALTDEGIEDHKLERLEGELKFETRVKLVNPRDPYRERFPKNIETYADRTIEHCLEHFVLGLHPTIRIVDPINNLVQSLDQRFKEAVRQSAAPKQIEVSGRAFNIHHLMLKPSYGEGHRLYFCADRRAVQSEKLEGRVANLETSLRDGSGSSFVYSGYVSGEYLDEMANTERTAFAIPETEDILGYPTWTGIKSAVALEAGQFLEPFTSPVKIEKEERIKSYVNNKAQTYRPLLKHKSSVLDAIPPNLSDEKLEIELYKQYQTYESELKEQSSKLLKSIEDGSLDDLARGYSKFLEEWNENGMAKLAGHVAHRKATLRLLRATLGLNQNAKYSLEDAIHGLIFPLRKTSEDVVADKMNLWVVDEKLAFHNYLASDIPFKQLREDIIKVESADRPDLIIFDQPSAFVDDDPPFTSVVILEFKRPARNDYTEEENPINQVYGYVRKIKQGKAQDRLGRPLNVPAHVRFYAYVLADLTETLKVQAENARLQLTSDGSGYFGFNDQIGVYVELISYDKLITDAERRNSFFFHQLGIL
jgi:hypothetical protein